MEVLKLGWLWLCSGCFGAIVDPAGHPCASDADCGSLVCDPEEMVCVDPSAGTEGSTSGTSTTLPSTSEPTTTQGSSEASSGSIGTSEEDSSSGTPGPLAIDGVVPDKGRADIDREVVVAGAGFMPGVEVFVGDDPAEILAVDAGEIRIRVPPNPGAIGPADVRVEQGDEMVTLPDGYTRVRAMPTFTALPVVSLFDYGAVPAAADMIVGQYVGDDALDLVVVAENGGDGVAVAQGDGNGDFDVVWEQDDPAVSVTAADVDADGELDFVTVGYFGLRTYVNDGFDGFLVTTFPGVLPYARGIATLDADQIDGPDVVVRSPFELGLQVWLNDGSGGLFAPTVYGAEEINSIDRVVHPSIGDFDGDGLDDILAPVEPPNAPVAGFATFLNDGEGGFLDPVFTGTGANGTDSVAAHVNIGADDVLDALVLGYETGIYTLAGNGDGTFEPNQISWVLPGGGGRVAAGDLNCDDANELVIIDQIGSYTVHRGSPGGSYVLVSSETYANEGSNRGLAVFDVDGDDLPDLVFAHYLLDGTLEIRPYRNTSAE